MIDFTRDISQNQSGLSLVEVLIAAGVGSIFMFAMISMQQNQLRSNNYLQFQMKRTEIQGAIAGQVLNDPQHCECLFKNAGALPFPASASNVALNVSTPPTMVGRYNFSSSCAGSTIPAPLVSDVEIDGVRATSIRLVGITHTGGGVYSGNLQIVLESTRQVLGPQDLPINIPVNVATTPAGGGNVNFDNCSLAAAPSTPTPPALATYGYPDTGTSAAVFRYPGCHAFCALSGTHDCNNCGYAVEPIAGSCPNPGHRQWRVVQHRGSMTISCFD